MMARLWLLSPFCWKVKYFSNTDAKQFLFRRPAFFTSSSWLAGMFSRSKRRETLYPKVRPCTCTQKPCLVYRSRNCANYTQSGSMANKQNKNTEALLHQIVNSAVIGSDCVDVILYMIMQTNIQLSTVTRAEIWGFWNLYEFLKESFKDLWFPKDTSCYFKLWLHFTISFII